MGKIYLITNLINGKKYVGLTTRNINIRWREHCRASTLLIDKAIIEYGKENFSITEIEECPDYDLDDREQYWISYYDSYKNGYNCTAGGRRETMVLNSEKKDWVA